MSWPTRCCWRHGVPPWLLTLGFGHNDMFWYRLIERLGRNSLVGTTVRDAAQLPEHLVVDEHHADGPARRATSRQPLVAAILGVALMASADDVYLQEAYGVFAAEARDVAPEYAPQTVNTDGWASTQNAFQTLFSPDHGGALFSARVLEDSRPLPQGPRTAPPGVGRLPCRHCGGVSTPDERVSAVVCNANLDRLGARDADEAVEQDGVLRGGLFPSGMPSHEQRGGSADEPAVPADVCKPGLARPSRLVRVTVTGLGLAVELSPLRPSEQPTPHPRQSRPSTQRQTLS